MRSSVGARVLPAYRIVTAGKVKIGLLGMTTERGIAIVGPKVTAGYTFTSGEAELPCFVNYLRNTEGVDIIDLAMGRVTPLAEIELMFSHIDKNRSGLAFPEHNFVFTDQFMNLVRDSGFMKG